jgi:hypothetical protein
MPGAIVCICFSENGDVRNWRWHFYEVSTIAPNESYDSLD